jgi:ubiquinone biosynthesis protein
MPSFKLIQKIRVLNRFNRILFAFIRLGAGYLIGTLGLRRHLPWFKKLGATSKPADPSDLPVRLRKTLEYLGPVFVKFGQILSTRSDLLPKEYIEELEHLQSHVPPFSYAEAQSIIEQDFKKPVHAVFKTFSKTPFASASLGQVYEATLKTGEKVAVKVQRPGAKKRVKTDIQVLYLAAHLIEKYMPALRAYNLRAIIDEFSRWTLNELDYRKEAGNCEIFANFFKDDPQVYSPKVFWEHSSASVLTLEFINGHSLSQIIANKANPKRKEIARLLADAFIKQCFDYGFFHADPHPGNIFIIEKDKLMLLDFGMVGFLDNRLASLATSMFLSLLQKDIDNLMILILQIEENYNSGPKVGGQKEVDANALRKELNELIIQWPVTSKHSGGFTRLFYEMINASTRHGVSVPIDLIMLSKAIVTLDRVVLDLDPEFQLEKWEQPLIEKIITKRLSPKDIQNKVQGAALVFEDLLQKLPETSTNILANLEKGRAEMALSHGDLRNYERLLRTNSRVSTSGIILAAILVAAALIYDSASEQVLAGLTLPQMLLITGGALAVLLVIGNLREAE